MLAIRAQKTTSLEDERFRRFDFQNLCPTQGETLPIFPKYLRVFDAHFGGRTCARHIFAKFCFQTGGGGKCCPFSRIEGIRCLQLLLSNVWWMASHEAIGFIEKVCQKLGEVVPIFPNTFFDAWRFFQFAFIGPGGHAAHLCSRTSVVCRFFHCTSMVQKQGANAAQFTTCTFVTVRLSCNAVCIIQQERKSCPHLVTLRLCILKTRRKCCSFSQEPWSASAFSNFCDHKNQENCCPMFPS